MYTCISSLKIPSYGKIIFLNIFHIHTSNSQLYCSMHLIIFYIFSTIRYHHGNHRWLFPLLVHLIIPKWITAAFQILFLNLHPFIHSFIHSFIPETFLRTHHTVGFPGGSVSKETACNEGDPGWIPGLGRFPGEGNGCPLQYSCLENPWT